MYVNKSNLKFYQVTLKDYYAKNYIQNVYTEFIRHKGHAESIQYTNEYNFIVCGSGGIFHFGIFHFAILSG